MAAVKTNKQTFTHIPKLKIGEVLTDLDGSTYRIGKELGRGGLGRVYLATNGNGVFAIKIPLQFERCPDLIVESRWTLRADAPHTVSVTGLGQHLFTGFAEHVVTAIRNRPIPFLVMPCMRTTIDSHLENHVSVPAGQAVRWIIQISTACQALGIVHRDLKPENLFLDEAGNALLGDFGLAIPANLQERERAGIHLTTRSAGAGTSDYLSPEQLAGAIDIGVTSDIYTLGMILFELLTGRPARELPHEIPSDNHHKIIDWCSQYGFAPQEKHFTVKHPHGLWPILERCFQIARGKRYPRHQDLIDALMPFAAPAP